MFACQSIRSRTRSIGRFDIEPSQPSRICRSLRSHVATTRRTPSTMQLAPSIFKAYDIRGVVPATLDEGVAEGLGRAFGTTALAQGERVVAVGRDGRLSGPSLSAALMRGLQSTGVEVIDVGHGHHADAVLRCEHAVQQRHSGHRQPQPQGLQRLQDGAGRPRHPRRRNPGAARCDGKRALAPGRGRQRTIGRCHARLQRPHHDRRQSGPPDEDCRRQRQRRRRRFGTGDLSRARLRRDRIVQRGRRQFSKPSSGPEQTGEPGRPDRRARAHAAPNSASRSTATATGSAS